jgi:hypothetical protein
MGIWWDHLSVCLALIIRYAWRGCNGSDMYCFGRSTHTIIPLCKARTFTGFAARLDCKNPFTLFLPALSSRIPLHCYYEQGIYRTRGSASRCNAEFTETYEIALYYTLLPLARSRQSL